MVFNLFFINLVTVGLHSYAGVELTCTRLARRVVVPVAEPREIPDRRRVRSRVVGRWAFARMARMAM